MQAMKSGFSLFIFLIISFSCRPPESTKFETRAVWMSRFEYAQDKNALESQEYIRSYFKRFRDAGINVVIFQVRGNADAFYKSSYEPWSKLLSDTLGKNPGWDPLEFALIQAHQIGLELHAWVNTFPAWRANDPPPVKSNPLHALLAHPEWIVCDSTGNPMKPEHGYITFSPGIPAVHDHIQNVVSDIIANYDVDGIHFDYIRYPESARLRGYSHDSLSVYRMNSDSDNPGHYDWETFQREQVNHFVETVYNKIEAVKPWVKVSAAVIGHHHGARWNGYEAVFQDAQRWMSVGKIDIVFPMTYQQLGHPTAPFESALEQWKHMMYFGRQIIPGIATYKIGNQYKLTEIWDQIDLIREENFPGMVFFSANSLSKILNYLNKSYYPLPALSSPLPWKKGVPIISATDLNYEVNADSIYLNWQFEGDAHCFVIYNRLPISDARNILTIIPGASRTYRTLRNKSESPFILTVVNRAGIEGNPQVFSKQFIAILNQVNNNYHQKSD